MPYNPYNPFSYNPYSNYNYGYQTPSPSQENYQYKTQNYHYLTFVNGIEGAKAFIVNPNQTIFLKDSDSDLFFEKKADAQGRYTINAFRLVPIDNSKKEELDLSKYATKEELNEIKQMYQHIEKLINKGDTNE